MHGGHGKRERNRVSSWYKRKNENEQASKRMSTATNCRMNEWRGKRIYKFNASKSGIIIGTNEMYLVRATLADYSVSLRQQSYRYSSHLNKIRQIRCGKLKFYFKQFFACTVLRDGVGGVCTMARSLELVGKCMLDYRFWGATSERKETETVNEDERKMR